MTTRGSRVGVFSVRPQRARLGLKDVSKARYEMEGRYGREILMGEMDEDDILRDKPFAPEEFNSARL